MEGRPTYARHSITNSNRGQTSAIIESTPIYSRHTIGDSNRGQTRAIPESILLYGRDNLILFYSFVTLYTILLLVWIII